MEKYHSWGLSVVNKQVFVRSTFCNIYISFYKTQTEPNLVLSFVRLNFKAVPETFKTTLCEEKIWPFKRIELCI